MSADITMDATALILAVVAGLVTIAISAWIEVRSVRKHAEAERSKFEQRIRSIEDKVTLLGQNPTRLSFVRVTPLDPSKLNPAQFEVWEKEKAANPNAVLAVLSDGRWSILTNRNGIPMDIDL